MSLIYLVGNHSCSNRGDAAITRGLLNCISKSNPDARLKVFSRFPTGASKLLGTKVFDDKTKFDYSKLSNNVIYKIFNRLNSDPIVLLAIVSYYIPFFYSLLPTYMKNVIDDMKNADSIIQVGGSFFVDLYGMSQFRLIVCAILADRPIHLIGHSLGPFGNFIYKIVAHWCFKKVDSIVIRDDTTKCMLDKTFPDVSYIIGADTAWLVDNSIKVPVSKKKKKVAFTFRTLYPFDKRLGITQEKYENCMVQIAEYLIKNGFELEFLSTCTSYDNYHNDDRVVAHRVKSKIDKSLHSCISVLDDEINDIELGQALSQCMLLIGTRLHSAIIGMNFGTPAIAIAYEHKATGLYTDMGLSDYSVMLSKDFNEKEVIDIFDSMVSNYESLRVEFDKKVGRQKLLAEKSVLKYIEP